VAIKQREKRYEEILNEHKEIPAAARAAILKAMAFCPEQRYQKAETFGEQLANALTTIPSPPDEPQPIYGTRAAILLLMLIVSGLITWFIIDRLRAPNNNQAANVSSNLNQTTITSKDNSNASENKPDVNRNQTDTREKHEIAYWLMTQQNNDEQLINEPKLITGQDHLKNGWHFKVYVKSQEPGYLYLINDDPSAQGSSLQILFPVPKRNNGQSEIAPNQPIEAFSGSLGKSSGTEHLWIVWSVEKVQELEPLIKYANETDKGHVNDQSDLAATRSFLSKFKQADAENDVQNQRVFLRGDGKVLVRELLLNHF
jgi:hypothetical protein